MFPWVLKLTLAVRAAARYRRTKLRVVKLLTAEGLKSDAAELEELVGLVQTRFYS